MKSFLEAKGHEVIELKHKEATKIGDLELTVSFAMDMTLFW